MLKVQCLRRLVAGLIMVFLSPVWAQQGGSSDAEMGVKEIQLAGESLIRRSAVPSWVTRVEAPESKNAAPLVIVLADTQVLADAQQTTYVHRVLRGNTAASLSELGQLQIYFSPEYQQIHLHGLRVIRDGQANDRLASASIRYLQRETNLEQGVYTGVVTASIVIKDLRVGDSLEYEYSTTGHNPVFGNTYFDSFGWDQDKPVELRRITFTHAAAQPIRWRFVGDGAGKTIDPVTTVVDGNKRLVFEQRDLPAVTGEQNVPPDLVQYRFVQFSEYGNWQQVASWAAGLFNVPAVVNPELQAQAQRIAKLDGDPARAVAALQWVQSEIRYFSMSLGESSHRPASPEVVLQRRYGDCKDKALLLVTLLKALGISSKPVLVSMQVRNHFDRWLPSPTMFDHAIVQMRLGDKLYYLDPTRSTQTGQLDHLGQIHENADVLVAASDTQQLVTIPFPAADDNAVDLEETAVLPKFDGDADLQTRRVLRGQAAEYFRALVARASIEQLNHAFEGDIVERYSQAKLIGNVEWQDDRDNNVFTLLARYKISKFAEPRFGGWMVRFRPDNMTQTFRFGNTSGRKMPIWVRSHPSTMRYRFDMQFPDDVSVVKDPVTTPVRGRFFDFEANHSFRGNRSRSTLILKTAVDRVSAAQLPDLMAEVKRLDNAAGYFIFVNGNAVKGVSVTNGAPRDFKQMLIDRQREAASKMTGAINSGKLSGADLASAYCDRSVVHYGLGNFDLAMQDGDEAVKRDPNAVGMLTCRAESLFAAKLFERAIADYSRALSLGDERPATYQRRGMAKFYLNDLAGALSDFQKALAITNGDEAEIYNSVWLALTYHRLHQTAPNVFLQSSRNAADGEWPRPALAMLTGAISVEAMLKIVDRKSGDDLQMTRSEAFFYAGQYYLGIGDKTKAKEMFQASRDQGVILYIEHIASGFELERLGSSR